MGEASLPTMYNELIIYVSSPLISKSFIFVLFTPVLFLWYCSSNYFLLGVCEEAATKAQPLVLVAVVWNRYVGNCCAGRSMVGGLFPPGRYGSHEGLPRTPKRLANGTLVKLGGLITN